VPTSSAPNFLNILTVPLHWKQLNSSSLGADGSPHNPKRMLSRELRNGPAPILVKSFPSQKTGFEDKEVKRNKIKATKLRMFIHTTSLSGQAHFFL
jgi:hypothetical protein